MQLKSTRNNFFKPLKEEEIKSYYKTILSEALNKDRKTTFCNYAILLTGYDNDSATNAKSQRIYAKDTLKYNILNKNNKPINIFEVSDNAINKYIKINITPPRTVTIIFTSHGAPSYIFGDRATKQTEINGIRILINLINKIEAEKFIVKTIILNACNSGTEFAITTNNDDECLFTNSSARLLSVALPQKNIIGFIGATSGIKSNGIWNERGEKNPNNNILNNSAIYQNGECKIYPTTAYLKISASPQNNSETGILRITETYKKSGKELLKHNLILTKPGKETATMHYCNIYQNEYQPQIQQLLVKEKLYITNPQAIDEIIELEPLYSDLFTNNLSRNYIKYPG